MQDGNEVPEERDPEPVITFVIRQDAKPDPNARRRLLEILFGPRADSDAA
jgi:hypothetical protein